MLLWLSAVKVLHGIFKGIVLEKLRPYHQQSTAYFYQPVTNFRTYVSSSPITLDVSSSPIDLTSSPIDPSSSHLVIQDRVEVYDDAIKAPILKLVDICASAGGLGHAVYLRTAPDHIGRTHDSSRGDNDTGSGKPVTPIEAVIESILRQLSDNCSTVEYWWRDDWISLDAHADIDEKLAVRRPDVAYRYPRHAHVLYLFVGQEVQAPTVIWTGSQSDTHLNPLQSPPLSPSSALPDNHSLPINHLYDRMYTVPAVASRLLRFQGSLLHGVPRPALGYMDIDTRSSYGMLFEASDSRKKHSMQDICSIPLSYYSSNHSRGNHPYGAIGSDNMTHSSSLHESGMMGDPPSMTSPSLLKYRRSVLLFNTWLSAGEDIPMEDACGNDGASCSIPINSPIGIERGPPCGTVSHYNSMKKDAHVAYLPLQHCNVNSYFVSKKLAIQHDECCGDNNPRLSSDVNESVAYSMKLKVGLLGDRRRRLTSANYLTLHTTSRAVQAFLDRCYPRVLPIHL